MTRLQSVNSVIAEFGDSIGLPDLQLDDQDRLRLTFDQTPVTLAYAAAPMEILWLYVDLGEVDSQSEQAAECLLQLGFLCWTMNKMTIALDEDEKRAVGFTAIPVAQLDLQVLMEVTRHLLDAAEAIRDKLARRDYDIDSTGTAAPPSGSLDPITLA